MPPTGGARSNGPAACTSASAEAARMQLGRPGSRRSRFGLRPASRSPVRHVRSRPVLSGHRTRRPGPPRLRSGLATAARPSAPQCRNQPEELPNRVTRSGSPPNLAMFARTQRSAASWSSSPYSPDEPPSWADRAGGPANPRMPSRYATVMTITFSAVRAEASVYGRPDALPPGCR